MQKMLSLLRDTRRIGNRSEVTAKFRSYIKNWYSDTGPKQMKRWNYNSEVLEDAESGHLVHSTNPSESVNAIFNNQISNTKNLNEVISAIKTFKAQQLVRFHETMELHRYPKKRKTTIFRHQRVFEIVERFNNLNIVAKNTEYYEVALNLGYLMCNVKS